MTRLILLLIYPLLFIGCSHSTKKYHEKHYQTLLCNELGGEMEYVLKDRTRVDCLTDEYAIEVDFAKKWAEGVGQSLFYSKMTGKKPAVALIVDKEKDQKYIKRIKLITQEYGVELILLNK